MTAGSFVHAWVLPHEIDADAWIALRHGATRVLRTASARLEQGRPADAPGILRGPDGLGLPHVTQECIAFNGSTFRGEAGDPFFLERSSTTGVVVRAGAATVGRAVRRCDTRGQPYDLAVCALLLLARQHLGDAMRLGSSGDLRGGWRAAADVVREATGETGELSQNEQGLIAWVPGPANDRHTRARSSA
jgi:hypothetical protein